MPDTWTTVESKHTRRLHQRQRVLRAELLKGLSAPTAAAAAESASQGARAIDHHHHHHHPCSQTQLCRYGDRCPYLEDAKCLFVHAKPRKPLPSSTEMQRRKEQSRAQLEHNAAVEGLGVAATTTFTPAPSDAPELQWSDRVALSPQAEKDYMRLSPRLQRTAHRIVEDAVANPHTKTLSVYQTKCGWNPEHVQHGWLNRGARVILKVHHNGGKDGMWVEIIRFTSEGSHDKVQMRVLQQYTLARQRQQCCSRKGTRKHHNLLARKPA